MSLVFRKAAGAAIIACAALLPQGAAAAPKAEDLVFYGPYLSKVQDGATLSYHYARTAEDAKLEPSFEDDIQLNVAPDGQEKAVVIELFSGSRARTMGPLGRTGNPLVIALLERNVHEMQKVLGGSPFYIRNRLREALVAGEPQAVKVDYAGRSVDGWKITLKPFEKDANRERFKDFADRTYEITFAEEAPGGLVALKSVTPRAEGQGPLLVEEVTLNAPNAAARP